MIALALLMRSCTPELSAPKTVKEPLVTLYAPRFQRTESDTPEAGDAVGVTRIAAPSGT